MILYRISHWRCRVCVAVNPVIFVYCIVLLAVPANAQSLVTGSEKLPAQFQAHTVDGKTIVGPLRGISVDWALHIGKDKGISLAAKDLVTIRQAKQHTPKFPTGAQIVLANGDRIPITNDHMLLTASELNVRFAPPLQVFNATTAKVPISYVAMLWLRTLPENEIRQWQHTSRLQDIVILRNGDQIVGTIKSFSTAKGCTLETERKQTIEISTERLAGIAFSTALLARPRLSTVHAQAILNNGARLTLTKGELIDGGEKLHCQAVFRLKLTFPVSALSRLDLCGNGNMPLSSLKPSKYEHIPFLGQKWAFEYDASLSGQQLRLGDRYYDAGISLHSAAKLTFPVDRKFRFFTATVGIDPDAGPLAHVVVDVLLDGQPQRLFAGRPLSAQDGPRSIRLDVSKARTITLVVDFGARGDVQDRVNWVDTMLLK